jgi:hypothetical protein
MMNILSVPENFLASKGVKNPKIIVYGTIAILAGIGIFLVIRTVKRRANDKLRLGLDEAASGSQLGGTMPDTTITSAEAILISQNLLNAMNRFGTDEEAIFDNLKKCKTTGDLELVIETFGTKPYSGYGLASTYISKNIAGVMKNLNGWLKAELGGSDLRQVKSIFDDFGVTF